MTTMTFTDLQHMLGNGGLHALGLASPLISGFWTSGVTPGSDHHGWVLQSSDTWRAPLAGIMVIGARACESIRLPAGLTPGSDCAVFRLNAQAYLRLSRLISAEIEGRTTDVLTPLRPMPYYFVYRNLVGNAEPGKYFPNDELGFSGDMTIHDRRGLPLDPVAVAELLFQLIASHNVLEMRDLGTTPSPPTSLQLDAIADIATSNETWVHLVNPHGQSIDNANIGNLADGLEVIDSASGLYKLIAQDRKVSRAENAKDSLYLGAATFGTLGEEIEIPQPALTLRRDFVRLMAVDTKPFLIGNPDPADTAVVSDFLPKVRHDETISFALNGNAALGEAAAILDGSPTVSIVVSPEINSDFGLPDDGDDANAQWPDFPDTGATMEDPLPYTLHERLRPSAKFVNYDDGNGDTPDIFLTLGADDEAEGLPEGLAVRVFSRRFRPDASETRGNGAGAVVKAGEHKVSFLLKDPLGLGDTGLPASPTLNVDVVLVNSKDKVRVIGNVNTTVDTAAVLSQEEKDAIDIGSNPFNTDTGEFYRGISPAAIVGLKEPSRSINQAEDPWQIVEDLGDDSSPREANRLPTMTRRDAVIASGKMPAGQDASWKAQLSGMHLERSSRTAKARLGNPGGPGGKEVRALAVQTEGGRLAYDIARAGLRRAQSLYERVETVLKDGKWAEPPAADGGTFSAALLQTVSPIAEMPALSMFWSDLTNFPDSFPADWQALVNTLEATDPDPSPPYSHVKAAFGGPLTVANDNDIDSRRYDEFRRDMYAAIYGRQEATWALKRAIAAAQEWIYIEGPAFSATHYPDNEPENLIIAIRARLNDTPNLRVAICLPKYLDYGPGYEMFAAREYAARRKAVEDLALEALPNVTINSGWETLLDKNTAQSQLQGAFAPEISLSLGNRVELFEKGKWWRILEPGDQSRYLIRKEKDNGNDVLKAYRYQERVVVFHPIGFPGRSQALKTNVVIVDDVWAMIGSSTLRRRGLTFDGGLDLVLFDRRISEGRSQAIGDLRRRLIAQHMGVEPPADGQAGSPNWIRIQDGQQSLTALRQLLDQGGNGLIEPLWAGPEYDPPLSPLSDDVGDPNGRIFEDPPVELSFIQLLTHAGLIS